MKSFRIPSFAGTSLLVALLLAGMVYVSPKWNPLSGVTASQAMFYAEMRGYVWVAYLVFQALPLINSALNTGSMILDHAVSAVPVLVAGAALLLHGIEYNPLSPWMLSTVREALVFTLFDFVIFGGLILVVNRRSFVDTGSGH